MDFSRLLRRGLGGIFLAALLAACQSKNQAPAVPVKSDAQLQTLSAPYEGRDVQTLVADKAAMEVGHELYMAKCASCHGADGHGGRGVMDLVAGKFNYGATPEAIFTTISEGRVSTMPSMKDTSIGEVDVGQLVDYVQSLSSGSDEPPTLYEKRGAELFALRCVACHGADGSGNKAVGGPDLTDDYWLNGDSMMNIRLLVTRGQTSQCPAHADTLSGVEMNLLTAYVLNLMQKPSETSAP